MKIETPYDITINLIQKLKSQEPQMYIPEIEIILNKEFILLENQKDVMMFDIKTRKIDQNINIKSLREAYARRLITAEYYNEIGKQQDVNYSYSRAGDTAILLARFQIDQKNYWDYRSMILKEDAYEGFKKLKNYRPAFFCVLSSLEKANKIKRKILTDNNLRKNLNLNLKELEENIINMKIDAKKLYDIVHENIRHGRALEIYRDLTK